MEHTPVVAEALRYHDTAVLENFHLATAFELMRSRHDGMGSVGPRNANRG